jgi:nucleotide-binding universal stress UspA family protein/GNAT superfamily N-acetyltransferase
LKISHASRASSRRTLAPLDPLEPDFGVLREAAQRARATETALELLLVVDPADPALANAVLIGHGKTLAERHRLAAERVLTACRAWSALSDLELSGRIVEGDARHCIFERARQAERVVLGARRRSRVDGRRGRVAGYLLRDAPCEVELVAVRPWLSAELPLRSLRALLPSGEQLLARPLLPQDEQRLRAGFERLSVQSRRFRFMSAGVQCDDKRLAEMLACDQREHIAYAIGALDDPVSPGRGEVCCFRSRRQPTLGEFAVTVIDDYQRCGVGSLLFGAMAYAAERAGLCTLRGYVLRDNRNMLRLLDRLGASRHGGGDGELRVDVEIPTRPGGWPGLAGLALDTLRFGPAAGDRRSSRCAVSTPQRIAS